MSTPHASAAEDGNAQRLKREEALHRSLRECTTRRLTHLFPCGAKEPHSSPLLTSRVQWSTERANSEDVPLIDGVHDVQHIEEKVWRSRPSPVLSEVDELVPSHDEQPRLHGHSARGVHSNTRHFHEHSTAPSDDGGSVRSYSEFSDTGKRQPSFPGGRDIIDNNRYPSNSPSPPSQHSAELETPSPVSDIQKGWKCSPSHSPSSSLDLRLFPNRQTTSRDDRNTRIGSWRVSSAPKDYHYEGPTHGRYGSVSHDTRDHRLAYSPSVSASSAPPSPATVLPPIYHLDAAMPVNTGRTPGVLHWRFHEPLLVPNLKRLSPHIHEYMDDYDVADTSSSGSPQALPPLLPYMLAQSYPPRSPMPAVMPLTVASQPTNPTRNKNAWKEHAEVVTWPEGQIEFRCVWRVGYAGETTDLCGYTAKRHLVKRHIETRHLQFKDHICPYCRKAFPQRVSLMIHVNRHTGAKPHPCRYVDCDKTFSDPARRHKHMVEAHGYRPQGPRKRHRTTDSYHANSHFETLAPWTAKPVDVEVRVTSS